MTYYIALVLCIHSLPLSYVLHNDRLYGSDDLGPGQARDTHGNG